MLRSARNLRTDGERPESMVKRQGQGDRCGNRAADGEPAEHKERNGRATAAKNADIALIRQAREPIGMCAKQKDTST